jgi:hypothetical protein
LNQFKRRHEAAAPHAPLMPRKPRHAPWPKTNQVKDRGAAPAEPEGIAETRTDAPP